MDQVRFALTAMLMSSILKPVTDSTPLGGVGAEAFAQAIVRAMEARRAG